MSVHSYIERQIIRRSLGTYFRRGKWVLHLVFLVIFWLIFSRNQAGPVRNWTVGKVALAISLTFPFILFFYTYCLYLVPYCFKQNKFRKFWTLLLLSLLIFPLLDFGLSVWAADDLPDLAKDIDLKHPLTSLGHTYFSFISSFVGFTALLYFMELLEGVSIYKETYQHQHQLAATELHLIKTQMNPDFVVRSLDGIIGLSERQDEHAPDSVINFSDVLRYRLYRSQEKLVPLREELTQLSNLMHLHNLLPGQEDSSSLETEGDPDDWVVVPLSLIKIAEPLLTTFKPGLNWSLLLYLLIDEKEVQVAAELSIDDHEGMDGLIERIREDLWRLLYSGLNFTVEKEQNTYSLRTCIPIFRNSTVSS
jgi:hypothetical protein